MKFDIYSINKYAVSSDTDSIFIKAEPLLIKNYGENYNSILSKSEIIKIVKDISVDFENRVNNFVTKRAKEILNVNDNQIEFKTETIIQKAYWSGKRRYAQYIVDKEGIEVEEFDMKGLDLMKSNFPALFRNFGEEIIKDILFSIPKKQIDDKIMEFKSSLQERPWKELIKPSGVKKISEYIEFPPNEGEIFSTLKKRCPINTRGAIMYNDLLRYKKLNIKYPEFRIGDKMYLAYLKDNPYKLSVIGLNGYDDPPFILELIEKYIDKEGIFNSVFKNKLENLYEDISWDLSLNPYREEFFDFE